MGIEPTSSAWKADIIAIILYLHSKTLLISYIYIIQEISRKIKFGVKDGIRTRNSHKSQGHNLVRLPISPPTPNIQGTLYGIEPFRFLFERNC